MKTKLTKILACSKCGSSLKLKSEKQSRNRILIGKLICAKCNISFEIVDGIICFKSICKQDKNKASIQKIQTMFRKELKEEWLKHYKKQETRALKEEWKWMMDYCKQNKIPPAQKWAWDRAKLKYKELTK